MITSVFMVGESGLLFILDAIVIRLFHKSSHDRKLCSYPTRDYCLVNRSSCWTQKPEGITIEEPYVSPVERCAPRCC